MKKVWNIDYKGHTIEVRTRPNSRLVVDGEVQDETFGFGTRSRLWGRIKSGEGAGEQIRASVGAEWWTYNCSVFIDDTQVFRT